MAQILVTPTPDPNVRNLKNDKAQNDEQARKKIQMLDGAPDGRARISRCWRRITPKIPTTAQNGGDLGFVPESALEKANRGFAQDADGAAPGEISPVMHTPEGYRILKVISKEPAGQRELTDPRVQQTIRETLINRKDQLLKAAYYEVARNEAKVVNYLAQAVAQTKDRK